MATINREGAFNINAINAEKATAMKEAITEYKSGVDTVLEKIVNVGEDSYLLAMKGDDQIDTIRTYISECVDSMKEVTTFIDQFQEAIQSVIDNYSNKSSEITAKQTDVEEIQDVDYTGVSGFSS